ALLQSFLVGQPELRDLMRAPTMQQLRQRIIASYHLGPMDKAETRAYVEHRLQRVGWKGDPAFDDEAFGRIFEATGGIPRRINQLCNRLLLSGYLAEKHALGLADVDEVAKEIGTELSADPPRAPVMVLPTAQRAAAGGEPVSMDFASLAATVDRMDGNIEVILDLLQSIVRPSGRDRTGTKSGGSSGG
ncbi:MAG: ATPase, partial [Burkholderiaceae bacterium]|nr:ATPase [Burkholderiaceae bacterium]